MKGPSLHPELIMHPMAAERARSVIASLAPTLWFDNRGLSTTAWVDNIAALSLAAIGTPSVARVPALRNTLAATIGRSTGYLGAYPGLAAFTTGTQVVVGVPTSYAQNTFTLLSYVGRSSVLFQFMAYVQPASNAFGAYLANGPILGSTLAALDSPACWTQVARAANDIDLRCNGSLVTRTSGTAYLTDTSSRVAVGNSPTGTQGFVGQIAASLFWARALTTNEMLSLGSALKVLYGVTL